MSATITLDELRSAIDSGDVTVVDTLGPIYFEASHIPGAINIPHTEVRAVAPELLPDRDAPIVTYCSNEACRNSGIAQAQLVAMGYTNVRKFAGGKQEWAEAGLSLDAVVAA